MIKAKKQQKKFKNDSEENKTKIGIKWYEAHTQETYMVDIHTYIDVQINTENRIEDTTRGEDRATNPELVGNREPCVPGRRRWTSCRNSICKQGAIFHVRPKESC